MKNGDPLLKGIRVVEAAAVIMVPSVATILSDYGAEVIKVEPPGLGDGNRQLHLLPGMPDSEIAYCYMQLNRNKRGIALNLKTEAGMKILRELIDTADIFLTNYRPPALARLPGAVLGSRHLPHTDTVQLQITRAVTRLVVTG